MCGFEKKKKTRYDISLIIKFQRNIMVFSSFAFIFVFLPCALLGFYILKSLKLYYLSKIFLVSASFVFYAYWKVDYLFLLFFSIVVNYFIANTILNKWGGVLSILV